MATIDEEIEAELQAKGIEKDNSITAEISDVEEQGIEAKPKKSKKVRSQAQIDAFEKARVKRAENFEKRKLLKEQEKLEKKEVKTKIKEEINNLSTEEIKEKIHKNTKTSKPLDNHQVSFQPQYQHQPPVINNYYYNTPEAPVKRGRKKKVVYVSDSDSDSDSDNELITKKKPSKQLDNTPDLPPPPAEVYAPAPLKSTRKLKYNFV